MFVKKVTEKSHKILIYVGQNVKSFDNILSVISFKPGIDVVGIPLIQLATHNNYFRKYYNFKELSKIDHKILVNFLLNEKNFQQEFLNTAYFGLKYRDHKIHGKSYKLNISYKTLVKEVSIIIQAFYKYYSTAIAILTALFFSQIGLPKVLPKVREHIFGQDFLDDFFFVPAFIFTIFESTTDLLLGIPLKDEPTIVRAFLSFLLWRHAKNLLKIPYNKLISLGINPKQICLTL